MQQLLEELNTLLDTFADAVRPASSYAAIVVHELKDCLSRIFAQIETANAANDESYDDLPSEKPVS